MCGQLFLALHYNMAYSDHPIYPFDIQMMPSECGISEFLHYVFVRFFFSFTFNDSSNQEVLLGSWIKQKKAMMDGFRDKEREGVQKETRKGSPSRRWLSALCFTSPQGSLLAMDRALTLSPNEGARRLWTSQEAINSVNCTCWRRIYPP